MGKYTPMPLRNIVQAQKEDPDIARVLAYKEQPIRPTLQDRNGESAEVKALMHEWSKLLTGNDGALYRKTTSKLQLVLPKRYHPFVLRHLHDDMGHLGAERVTELVRDRFYWPHMARDIQHYVTKVGACLQRKRPSLPPRAPAQSIVTSQPFELISIDFVHLEPGGGGTWPTKIRGRAAGKSKKLPCLGVKFPKMIPCPGVKFSQTIPCPLVSSDKFVLCKEICVKSIEKCGNIAIEAT